MVLIRKRLVFLLSILRFSVESPKVLLLLHYLLVEVVVFKELFLDYRNVEPLDDVHREQLVNFNFDV